MSKKATLHQAQGGHVTLQVGKAGPAEEMGGPIFTLTVKMKRDMTLPYLLTLMVTKQSQPGVSHLGVLLSL